MYEELVKALRSASTISSAWEKLMLDAAAAIEDLQRELSLAEIAADDNGRQVEELQAEVDALKHDLERYVQMNTDLLNEPLQVGKAGNQYTLIEPKRGEWIDGDGRRVTARCSVCGHLRLGNGAEYANKSVHFCENCGSKMGGQNDEP